MKRISILLLALLSVSGCETAASRKNQATSVAIHGIAAALAGEWSALGGDDEYLLFKPDEMEPKTGRFAGLGNYSRYEIKDRFSLGGSTKIELDSPSSDGESRSVVVSADVSADGQSLVLTIPAKHGGPGSTVRKYRKVAL